MFPFVFGFSSVAAAILAVAFQLGALGAAASAWTAFLVLASVCIYIYGELPRYRLLHIPGPPSRWGLGSLDEFFKAPYPEVHRRLAQQYGAICAYAMGRASCIQVTDVDAVLRVTLKEYRKFPARPVFAYVPPFSRKAFIFNRGEPWSSNRAVLTPVFHTHGMKALKPAMAAAMDDMMGYLRRHVDDKGGAQVVEMAAVLKRLGMEVISRTAYSLPLGLFAPTTEPSNLEFMRAIEDITRLASTDLEGSISVQIANLLPMLGYAMRQVLRHVPGTRDHRQFEAIRYAADTVAPLLEDRLRDVAQGKSKPEGSEASPGGLQEMDILRMLAAARDKATGAHFERERMLSAAQEFFAAGSDTTSNTLTFALYHLSNDPHVQDKLIAEVDAFGRDRPPSYEDLVHGFPYTECVVKETLRFYPTATTLVREAAEEAEILGYRITPGMTVFIPVNAIHMDPKHFPDPAAYLPERFDPEGPEEKARPSHAFIPFGSGPRMCLGFKFAMLEAKMGLVRLFQRYTFARCAETRVPIPTATSILVRPESAKLLLVPRN
eukprot:jgi/Mesvir1/4795/Mv11091-RA.1